MAVYTVEIDGQQYDIEGGDAPPTEAEARAAVSAYGQPESKSVGGLLKNVVSDVGNIVGGMVNTVRHPLQTAQALLADKQQFNERSTAAAEEVMQNGVSLPSAGEMGSRVKSFAGAVGDAAYREPVQTAMLAMPAVKPIVNLRPIKSGLESMGVRAMRGALKPNTAMLEKMPGARQAGIDAASDTVARTALEEGINPLRASGAETLQRRIDALDSVRNADIAAAPAVPVKGSGVRQLAAIKKVERKLGPHNQTFAESDVAEVGRMRDELRRNPARTTTTPLSGGRRIMRDRTPQEIHQSHKGDNRALQGKFGKANDAEIDTRKALASNDVTELENAVPGTKATGQKMRKLIDLRNIGNVARKRGENRDLVGINDVISLAAGRPEVMALSTAMRPAAQAGIGGAAYRLGTGLPANVDLTGLYRLALLQQLAGEQR